MTREAAPFRHFTDLDRLGQVGADVSLTPKPSDLAHLAQWAQVDAVERFDARVHLDRLAQTRFRLSYELDADIVQSCVVTLEPVKSHIAREFSRELHVTSSPERAGGSLTLDAAADEVPEEIASPHFDLMSPLLEEFVLAIDPYPRAAGAAFEAPKDAAAGVESPFAVLKSLKRGS